MSLKRRNAIAKKKVLAIDDDKRVLDRVNTILTDGDYGVDVSLRGREGLDWALQRNYDLVLTDVRMPDIGGMRVLRDIQIAKPSLPVIIIAGYSTIQSAEQAMKLGAADYLEKPFTPKQLLTAVALAIAKAAARDSQQQTVIHKEEMIKVLERAAFDNEFIFSLLDHGADALDGYDLSKPEKLALLTADFSWIEDNIGPLTPSQKRWLELRKQSKIW